MPIKRDTFYVNEKGQLIRKYEDMGTRFIRRGLGANEEIVDYRRVKDNVFAQNAVRKYEKETGKKFDDKVRWLFSE